MYLRKYLLRQAVNVYTFKHMEATHDAARWEKKMGIVSKRMNVTLTSSHNKCLTYPCSGELHITEIGTFGQIITATFQLPGKAPVRVKNPEYVEVAA